MSEWKEVEGTGSAGKNLEIGESVEGTFAGKVEGTYGPNWKIKTENGEEVLYGKTILSSKMEEAIKDGLKEGDEIKIERVEDTKTGEGRVAQDYKVYVK